MRKKGKTKSRVMRLKAREYIYDYGDESSARVKEYLSLHYPGIEPVNGIGCYLIPSVHYIDLDGIDYYEIGTFDFRGYYSGDIIFDFPIIDIIEISLSGCSKDDQVREVLEDLRPRVFQETKHVQLESPENIDFLIYWDKIKRGNNESSRRLVV